MQVVCAPLPGHLLLSLESRWSLAIVPRWPLCSTDLRDLATREAAMYPPPVPAAPQAVPQIRSEVFFPLHRHDRVSLPALPSFVYSSHSGLAHPLVVVACVLTPRATHHTAPRAAAVIRGAVRTCGVSKPRKRLCQPAICVPTRHCPRRNSAG